MNLSNNNHIVIIYQITIFTYATINKILNIAKQKVSRFIACIIEVY